MPKRSQQKKLKTLPVTLLSGFLVSDKTKHCRCLEYEPELMNLRALGKLPFSSTFSAVNMAFVLRSLSTTSERMSHDLNETIRIKAYS